MALYHISGNTVDRVGVLLSSNDAGTALLLIARELRSAEGAQRKELLELQARAYADLACMSMELAYGQAATGTSGRARQLISDGLGLYRGDADGEPASVVPEIPAGVREPNELERMKLEQIFQALEAADYIQSVAADALKISKFQMHRELRKFGLTEEVRRRRAER